jgi:serine O-acetyltransferase
MIAMDCKDIPKQSTNQADFISAVFKRNTNCFKGFPNRQIAEQFIDELYFFMFGSHEKYLGEEKLVEQYEGLKTTFSDILFDLVRNEEKVKQFTNSFFETIPSIYTRLLLDAEAIVKFDPAAQSIEEVLVAYPGFYATAVYRFAHELHSYGIKTLPRLVSEYAHSKTGIDIHPGAEIGESFFIDHGTGIVIGETAVIGNNVKVYQGVTLGALNVAKSAASTKRHPTIEDNVIIYSGATILGGDTIIGHNSIIGGNVWLTYGVPPYSVVYHKSEIQVRDKNPLPEALNFVI